MIVEVNGTRMDIKHRVAIILQGMHEIGGEANTRDLTSRTGLKGWEVHEAAKQAEERGLVEFVGYDSASYGPGDDPRLYEITGHGQQVVGRGVVGKVITLHEESDARLPAQEVEDLKTALARVEGRVDAELTERFDELRARLDEVDGLDDAEHDALCEDLRELEAYVFEWTENAEAHILAIKRALEAQGVDVEQYIKESAT